MDYILIGYEVNRETWFYHSLLLIIAVFFKFGRFWSLRNFDLAVILSLSPGIVLVHKSRLWGFAWLLTGTAVLLFRLLLDPLFQRRPRLEQNLNTSGLAFLCVSSMAFLAANAWNADTTEAEATLQRGQELITRTDLRDTAERKKTEKQDGTGAGPASSLVGGMAVTLSKAAASMQSEDRGVSDAAARVLAIGAHIAVIIGLVLVGKWQFGDLHIGLGMATFYLLLPCTAYDVEKVNHVLPAALIVWAIAAYQRPMVSGALLGLACGTLIFPIFLLPLWMAFYGRYGAVRFALALSLVATVLLATLILTSADSSSFMEKVTIDWDVFQFREWNEDFTGIWTRGNYAFRIPVFALYCLLTIALSIWPRQKTLEHLIAHSAVIVVATQFWYPRGGGMYMLWYVPLVLIVIFRPRLGHLVAPWRTAGTSRTEVQSRGPRTLEPTTAG